MKSRLLMIGVHAADFVWRSAGVAALITSTGRAAVAVAFSYGERSESAERWTQPGRQLAEVKLVRHQEATRAAAILKANFLCLDLGDYPLEVGRDALERLADIVRDFEPTAVITHTERDPF